MQNSALILKNINVCCRNTISIENIIRSQFYLSYKAVFPNLFWFTAPLLSYVEI